jgi:hypothetical protein
LGLPVLLQWFDALLRRRAALFLSCECRITAAGLELCSTVVFPAGEHSKLLKIALLPDAAPANFELPAPRKA